MKKPFRQYTKYAVSFLAFVFAISLINWGSNCGFYKPSMAEAKITPKTVVLDKNNPQIKKVIAIQNRHTPELLSVPEVVGTATGLNDVGGPSILVFTKQQVKAGKIPKKLEGTPVVVKVVGEFVAMKPPADKGGQQGKGGGRIDPTSRLDRPVPIGVSTGNIGECSAGTIGARVTDGTHVYALSNNHVYALGNQASLGSEVLQPGRYEDYDRKTRSCPANSADVIGTLADFQVIDFNPFNSNSIDAAIALTSTEELDNSTPADGYGTPASTPVEAVVGQAVQKYGRSSSLTKGTITAINADVIVHYDIKMAFFEDQIIVESKKAFIKAGDSGSLLVTDDANSSPVGLLFAGNSSGTYAIANPIGPVLERFGVTIDGN